MCTFFAVISVNYQKLYMNETFSTGDQGIVQVAPWFEERVMGKGTLGSTVKTMCAKAGSTGNKTNHSLKATGATRMFEGNVPDKIIQE